MTIPVGVFLIRSKYVVISIYVPMIYEPETHGALVSDVEILVGCRDWLHVLSYILKICILTVIL